MSEFECSCGNLIRPSVGYCEICGGRAVRMDGMTGRELARQEELDEAAEDAAREEEYRED